MDQKAPKGYLSIVEIEAGLAALGPSPQDNGRVEMIVRRPAPDDRQVVEAAELDPAVGLVGDNWLARGSRATPDGSALLAAQITLMNSRTIQALAQERGRWALAGDQLFVDLDLSEGNLPAGQRLAIGTAVLEITAEPHTGCAKFTERYGGGATRFVNSHAGLKARRRGVNARVAQAGTIHAGDAVRKMAG